MTIKVYLGKTVANIPSFKSRSSKKTAGIVVVKKP